MRYFQYLIFTFLFLFLLPTAGYCFSALNSININIDDVIAIVNAAMGGLVVVWGLRKAVKFINRT